MLTIISTGESGANRVALLVAKSLGLGTGGWCQGKLVKDPNNQGHLKATVGMTIVKGNVDNSDGTIIFRVFPSLGTDLVMGYCISGKFRPFLKEDLELRKTRYKPCLIISDLSEEKMDRTVEVIRDFLRVNRIKVLNITGHRDGVLPGYTQSVMDILVDALSFFPNK